MSSSCNCFIRWMAVPLMLLAACTWPLPADAAPAPLLATNSSAKTIRDPAVAGLFYPKEEKVLSRLLDQLLETASVDALADVRALICPHAGYAYSGLTAATAYKTLLGRKFDRVIILAPSHYAAFNGACVPKVDAYRTPLGMVEIASQAKSLARITPCVLEPRALVQRPGWWPQASKAAPPEGEDTPETWEHSAEVQVPFLQKVLPQARIVPIVLGRVSPQELARAVASQLDEQTLIVASSDLSHYSPYEQAKQLDRQCVKAICNLDIEAMENQEACGKVPILTLLHLAKQKGWKARLLDYRNSGDTAGDKRGVVGYAAIAFYAPGPEHFGAGERKTLLELARKTVKEVVEKGYYSSAQTNGFPPKFFQPTGCFVTLTTNGELRGCIGHIVPQEPLYRAIQDNAQSAARRDPRFLPVQPDELGRLEIEISILTEPQPLKFGTPDELLNQLQPYKDGVVLKIGARGATYLPQVWGHLPNKVQFLDSLAQKAGCERAAWRQPGTAASVYRVESFKESE